MKPCRMETGAWLKIRNGVLPLATVAMEERWRCLAMEGRLAKEVSCWLPALLPAGWTVALHTSATTGSVFRARLKPLARHNKTDKAGLGGAGCSSVGGV